MLDRNHTQTYEYFRANSPDWMSEEGIKTLMKGYLLKDETPNQMYERLSKTAAAYLPSTSNLDPEKFARDFEYVFKQGWLSPATPVASNLGSNDSAFAVSCLETGTKIHTCYGMQNIEKLEIGDYILTHTGDYQQVIGKKSRRTNGDLWKLTVENNNYEPLYITGNHPVLTDAGWVKVEDMFSTDLIITYAFNEEFCTDVLCLKGKPYTLEKENRETTVWDIEVEKDHSFVAQGIVVHNCYGLSVGNSVYDITQSVTEASMLSKYGGGLGIDLSNIIGNSPVQDWAKFFDTVGSVISQNSTRRGAVALYLDFSHRDILSFLNAKDLLNGDVRERLDCNIAIKLTNADIERIRNEEPEALEIFTKILELRMKYGSPYLQFMDNCWDADPVWYKDKEMKSGASQLCLVGETEVLTLFGKEIIKDLDGKTVEIFDGRRWVENKNFRKTGTAIALITIKVYGIEEPIVCTFNHEFPVVHENGMISKVKARNLTQKHRLILSDLNGREELKVIAIKHISIQFLSEPVDVYCTTVESTANFTLGCGILSGNCSEINLYHDSEHTYACVLSSLNVEKYQEWKDYRTTEGYSLPFLGIVFLDSVCEDLIARAEGKKGMENVVRGAKAGRPLGLGVLGLHGLYQSLNLPWESAEAEELNLELFQFISTEGIKASKFLAKEIGEPEWTKGYGMRNTHLFCCAPTTTNSVLCNASSPGIEPAIANYFAMEGAKGTFNRQNKYLVDVLNQLGMNNGSVWASIRENLGSVQHLEFLTEHQKNVFKTALEINQFSLIKQAADRQPYIDQGQSLNLFIRCTEDAQKIIDIHLDAADMGIKTLYYLRSDSKMHNANSASNGIDFVYLKTRDDCEYCAKAKDLLDSKNVQYITEYKPTGRVPEIWINGEKLDDGYNSLKKRFNVIDDSKIIQTDKSDCVSCEG